MERLTYRGKNGKGHIFSEYHGCNSAERKRAMVADRLAAYEDTGLEPEDIISGLELAEVYSAILLLKQYEAIGTIDDLTALVKARDEGRFVALPCKAGDTVWNIKSMFSFRSEPKEEVIDRFVIFDGGVDVAFRSGYKFAVERIGKTIFLTRAEAEAALKGVIAHEAD